MHIFRLVLRVHKFLIRCLNYHFPKQRNKGFLQLSALINIAFCNITLRDKFAHPLKAMGKENDFKPLIQEQMALKNCFCYLITWAVREKVVKVKSMIDKRCNSMGPTAVHLILIFNSPLF